MFSLSFFEIIAIAVLALVFIGPKQLPEVARTIARVMNELRRTTTEFSQSFYELRSDVSQTLAETRDTLKKQAGLEDLSRELNVTKDELQSTLRKELDELKLDAEEGSAADEESYEAHSDHGESVGVSDGGPEEGALDPRKEGDR